MSDIFPKILRRMRGEVIAKECGHLTKLSGTIRVCNASRRIKFIPENGEVLYCFECLRTMGKMCPICGNPVLPFDIVLQHPQLGICCFRPACQHEKKKCRIATWIPDKEYKMRMQASTEPALIRRLS